jgi:hypothetical protein
MFFFSLYPNTAGAAPDIRLVTSDNHTLLANRAVLAAHSQFFRNALSNPQTGAELRLGNISAAQLKPVLKCLKNGCLLVHRENVLKIISAAYRLGIAIIDNACFMYLEKNFRPRDAVDVFEYATKNRLPHLADFARLYVFNNFRVMSRRRELRRASERLLIQLFVGIGEYVDGDSTDAFINAWCHSKSRPPSGELCAAMRCKQTMAKSCAGMPGDQNMRLFLNDRILDSVLFVLGGEDGAEQLISIYNPVVNVWTHLETPLPYPWTNMGAVYFGGGIVVCGGDCEADGPGSKDFSKVAKLNLATMQWQELPSLDGEHYNGAAVVLGNRLYVIGGNDMDMDATEVVERYSHLANQWELGRDLVIPRTECGAVSFGNRIYVIGGYDSMESLNSVTIYNSETGNWEPGPHMPIPLSSVRAAIIGRKIFVAGGNSTDPETGTEETVNKCFSLDLDTGVWTERESMSRERQFHCLVALNDRLVVLGSEPEVESFHPGENRWTVLGETTENRTNAAACTVPLSALGHGLMAILEPAWVGPN